MNNNKNKIHMATNKHRIEYPYNSYVCYAKYIWGSCINCKNMLRCILEGMRDYWSFVIKCLLGLARSCPSCSCFMLAIGNREVDTPIIRVECLMLEAIGIVKLITTRMQVLSKLEKIGSASYI